MGLFDKRDKKRGGKDDFDSPVESIDLSSVGAPAAASTRPAEPAAPAAAAAPEKPADRPTRPTDGMPQIEYVKEPAKESAKEPKPMPARGTPEHEDYGIDKAIELMRTLPSENIELVVQVVKFSLESVGIKLPTIIEDAIRRQKDIQGRIGVLRGEIAELEQEIKTRKEEIDRLEADHKETSTVRERLELAENLGNKPRTSGTMPAMGAVPAPVAQPGEASSPSSSGIPRVTRQTGAPPLSANPSSSPIKK